MKQHFCNACNSTNIGEREIVVPTLNVNPVALPSVLKAPVFVFCTRGSHSARDLAEALMEVGVPAERIKTFDGLQRRIAKGKGLIVAWGEKIANAGALPVLNRAPLKDKYLEIQKLKAAGVTVPEFKPYAAGQVGAQGWLKRSRDHQSANDLRFPANHTPAFWSKKIYVKEEWRVHVFNGASIRVGRKEKGNDTTPATDAHPWIRSLSTGWKLNYGATLKGHPQAEAIRTQAKAAVAALGLNFGAVDTYVTPTGQVGVFEVNTSPSISNDNTAGAYALAIKKILTP